MVLRPAGSCDIQDINDCVQEAYRPYIQRIGKPPAPMLVDYSEIVTMYQTFVAVMNERVVGILVLIPREQGLLLDNVAVRPEFQGRGIGGKLLKLAEAEARKQGLAQLDLYTHERMIENIKMYKYLGYVETKRCTEAGYQRVYLRKTLI